MSPEQWLFQWKLGYYCHQNYMMYHMVQVSHLFWTGGQGLGGQSEIKIVLDRHCLTECFDTLSKSQSTFYFIWLYFKSAVKSVSKIRDAIVYSIDKIRMKWVEILIVFLNDDYFLDRHF